MLRTISLATVLTLAEVRQAHISEEERNLFSVMIQIVQGFFATAYLDNLKISFFQKRSS